MLYGVKYIELVSLEFFPGTTFTDAGDAAITINVEDHPEKSFRFAIKEMDSTKSAVLLGAFNKVDGK